MVSIRDGSARRPEWASSAPSTPSARVRSASSSSSFLALVVLGAFSLLAWRLDRLRAQGGLDSIVSCESPFLLNNLFLIAAAFTVFFGTVFPLLSEAVKGVKVSVGAPFFNLVNIPILLALIFLMGVGPLIAWRRASAENLKRNFLKTVVIGIAWRWRRRALMLPMGYGPTASVPRSPRPGELRSPALGGGVMKWVFGGVVTGVLLLTTVAAADEAPISGTVKAVDVAAQTVTLESTAKGKTRQVVVHLKPGARIVKFVRATEPGKTGFVKQSLALTDLKPGWIVSVQTKHEGNKEVAELVKVVLER